MAFPFVIDKSRDRYGRFIMDLVSSGRSFPYSDGIDAISELLLFQDGYFDFQIYFTPSISKTISSAQRFIYCRFNNEKKGEIFFGKLDNGFTINVSLLVKR